MCGICGVYNYRDAQPANAGLVRTMTASMVHRGPDDDGFYVEGPVALGMRRLSIIDLTGGAQPIANEAGTAWCVFNGEIYNYRELRAELLAHGHTFRTRSDTETIVHAYEQWGVAGLARLNGMFAIALWDVAARRLILARDPFGVKPLYYHDAGGTLRFGSEIRALLCDPSVPVLPDRGALEAALQFLYVPAPDTAFTGIKKLLPGFAVVCDGNGCRLQRFQGSFPRTVESRSEGALLAELEARIETAVRRQMVADVPVGVMLSGGIDSAIIATMMTESRMAPVEAFTAGFEGDFASDELDAAASAAARLGCKHHTAVLSAREFAESLPFCVAHMEEPIATASLVPFFKICKVASQTVKVVLTGQGADEPFAGYGRYLGERYGAWYRAIPGPVRAGALGPLLAHLPSERLQRAARALGEPDPVRRLVSIYRVADPALLARLVRDGRAGAAEASMAGAVARWLYDVPGLDGLSRMLYADSRLSLADNLLIYGDKIAMASSLEARVPFLDLELMEFVESLPAGLKIRGLEQKYLLKRAALKWIPKSIVSRKKIGFETPVATWLRGELHGWARHLLLDQGSASRQYFDARVLGQILQEHRDRVRDHRLLLFSLITFELWYREFIVKPGARSPAAAITFGGEA